MSYFNYIVFFIDCYIGLMLGISLDGVDGVLVDFFGEYLVVFVDVYVFFLFELC